MFNSPGYTGPVKHTSSLKRAHIRTHLVSVAQTHLEFTQILTAQSEDFGWLYLAVNCSGRIFHSSLGGTVSRA